jgi:hypothetical protein
MLQGDNLGIVAKARAMMYFDGQVLPVSFDSKEELAKTNTTDLIIVEKEGITDVLLEAARKYRIGLVATGGDSLTMLRIYCGLQIMQE